jgi:hypothetical protein
VKSSRLVLATTVAVPLLACVLAPRAARADHTINLGTFNVTAPNFNSLALTGIPAGTYTDFQVTVNWTAVSGNPFSNEARLGFANYAAPGNSTTGPTGAGAYYVANAPTSGSAGNGNAATLSWAGSFASAYTGGALNLWFRQTWSTSVSTWGNVSVLLKTGTPPTNTPFSGTTAGRPTWTRPVANGTSAPNSLSGTGTATPFSVQAFTVASSGIYNLTSTSVAPSGWDNYTFLYSNSFDPLAPLANCVIGNDDLSGVGTSGFSASLTAGTTYYFVTTGFSNTDFGTFSNNISGPGAATLVGAAAVPESGTLALALFGGAALLGVGAARRRRKVCEPSLAAA